MSAGISTLIWDLDGTLLDSKAGVVDSFVRAARDVFPNISLDPARVPVGPAIRQLARAVFPEISDADNEKLALAFRKYYDTEGCMTATLYEGGRDVLSILSQCADAMDIATNKPRWVTHSLLAHFDIARFFRTVMTVDSSDPPFSGKAAMVRRLLDLHGRGAGETVYIGDTAEDAAAAAACGIRFIWASYGYGRLAEGTKPMAIINRLADMIPIL